MNKLLCCGLLCLAAALPAQAATKGFNLEEVQDKKLTPVIGARGTSPSVLRAQILLERAHFSPGELDAAYGTTMKSAIAGYQRQQNLPINGVVDARTWAALNRDTEAMFEDYQITEEDVSLNSTRIPADMMDKAKLDALGYATPDEALGERFHISPQLLARLNPGKNLREPGTDIIVPNVKTTPIEGAARVVVDKFRSTVSLLDAQGKILAQFPATIGSQHDPLPIGEWKIKGVARNPTFKYNPDLFWDAESDHAKATLQPGPNNPVGVAWIDLSKEHYGIHGTPEPSSIRKSSSHGCIRMTNWSVQLVAEAVKPGMPATLTKQYKYTE